MLQSLHQTRKTTAVEVRAAFSARKLSDICCKVQPNPMANPNRRESNENSQAKPSQVKSSASSFLPNTDEIRHPDEVLCSVVSYYLEIECWLLKFYEAFLQLQLQYKWNIFKYEANQIKQ